jgi:lactoylglutathione lyase
MMSTTIQAVAGGAARPNRLLHTMLRVNDLQRSLAFYVDALGMRELRRETYPAGRFTLVFVGYDDEASAAVIELTHNWEGAGYQLGTAFGHVAVGVTDARAACERLASMAFKIVRAAGPATFAPDSGNREVIAFVEDPDGYRVELIECR